MKRFFALFLVVVATLPVSSAFAVPMTIDLDDMLVTEIDALIEMAKAEKREATEFSSYAYSTLENAFKQAFKSMLPSGAEVSYPLFGLSKERSREMYMLSGDVTVKYADKSKKKFSNVTTIHWLDEWDTYNLAAFFSDEQVYFFDETYFSKVSPHVSESIKVKINPNGMVLTDADAMTTETTFDPVEAKLDIFIDKFALQKECKTVIMEYLPDFWSFDRMEQEGLSAYRIIMTDGTEYYLTVTKDNSPMVLQSAEKDQQARTRYYDKFAK